MIEEKHISVTLNFDATPDILHLISQGMRVSASDEITPLKKRINELEDALQTKNLMRENDYSMALGAKNEKITELQQIIVQLTGEIHDLKEINDSL